MKKALVALVLGLGTPLAAQVFETGLFLGQQQYPSQSNTGHGPAPGGGTQSTEAKAVLGIRFGYLVADLGSASFQLTAGYQPQSSTPTPAFAGGTFTESHESLGGMVLFKTRVFLGAGLEYRLEQFAGSWAGWNETSSNHRIWSRLDLGYVSSRSGVKPFLCIEVAIPLTTAPSGQAYSPFNSDTFRALAPKSQVGIYTGLRF
jgi:hypothetical protein